MAEARGLARFLATVTLALFVGWLIACCIARGAHADASPVVRVGVLKYGTVNWELDVMRRNALDHAHGFTLEPVELAGKDGAVVALQGGAVDVILTDWLWVARRRALGGDFTFVPHSHATGGLMVRRDSGIRDIADLKGRKLGVGGGPIDKSWLVLRAYARKVAGIDLARDATPVFAAPPLLAETLKKGDLPAAINFWPYNARLPRAAFSELVSVETMLPALGIAPETPLLGWVFSERWAAAHPAVAHGFLVAAKEARERLAGSAEEWQKVAHLTGTDDPEILERLHEAYRRGVGGPEPADIAGSAQRLLDLLIEFGGIDETPPDGRVPPGTFFAGAAS